MEKFDFYIDEMKSAFADRRVRRWLPLICSAAALVMILFYIAVGAVLSVSGAGPVQEGIADKIIRFHVVGNSNSDEDQAVKLKVKEAVVKYLEPLMAEADSRGRAMEILNENLPSIEALSRRTLEDNGFGYGAAAEIGITAFPVKKYGDIVLPAGDYEALQISLGSAEGKNWWCIMFPQLCFIDSTYSVVPDESKEKLKYILTGDEYDAIVQDECEVEYHSFFFDLLKKLFG